MKVDLLINNAQVIGDEELQQVAIESGKIKAIAPQLDLINAQSTIDFGGDWLSLGGVDLQINGGLGLAFPDLELKDLPKLKKICNFLYAQGVDGFLPTIVTTSVDKIKRSLFVLAQFISTQDDTAKTAKVLGVHLEGPFLNYSKTRRTSRTISITLNCREY